MGRPVARSGRSGAIVVELVEVSEVLRSARCRFERSPHFDGDDQCGLVAQRKPHGAANEVRITVLSSIRREDDIQQAVAGDQMQRVVLCPVGDRQARKPRSSHVRGVQARLQLIERRSKTGKVPAVTGRRDVDIDRCGQPQIMRLRSDATNHNEPDAMLIENPHDASGVKRRLPP